MLLNSEKVVCHVIHSSCRITSLSKQSNLFVEVIFCNCVVLVVGLHLEVRPQTHVFHLDVTWK
jgi:hypothetical protein